LGDHQRAIEDYDKAIKINPKKARYYLSRGKEYADLGNSVQATADCDQAIAIDPNNPDGYSGRGDVYASLGDYRRAIQDYDKALSMLSMPRYPKNIMDMDHFTRAALGFSDFSDYALAGYYSARARAYSNLGDHQKAIDDYGKAIEIHPKDAYSYLLRGAAYSALDNHQQAIENYNKAIEIEPNNALGYFLRGAYYFDSGNYRQSIENYGKAIVIDPKNSMAYRNRGEAYSAMGNQGKATEDYKIAAGLGDEFSKNFLAEQKEKVVITCTLAMNNGKYRHDESFELNETKRTVNGHPATFTDAEVRWNETRGRDQQSFLILNRYSGSIRLGSEEFPLLFSGQCSPAPERKF